MSETRYKRAEKLLKEEKRKLIVSIIGLIVSLGITGLFIWGVIRLISNGCFS